MARALAWAGIDPGLSGCACLLTVDRIVFHDYVDEITARNKISEWNDCLNVKFFLERQVDVRKKGFNVSGKLLINYGFWVGLFTGLNCNWVERMPQTWQKIMPKGPLKFKDTKERALYWSRKYYPAASGPLSLKKSHNRADALLMAHFIRKNDLFIKI